ncbi:uncharacterized protein LOC103099653 [Monodelphis domestica]|uniref:uncharacterized protein LOC103099653 n=1 Tax=Monodelphis domestica TaxID=13616 RepID=UPI0004432C9E|nr:uncharacterized protein LOC103099653 [Monodelphis domestica]
MAEEIRLTGQASSEEEQPLCEGTWAWPCICEPGSPSPSGCGEASENPAMEAAASTPTSVELITVTSSSESEILENSPQIQAKRICKTTRVPTFMSEHQGSPAKLARLKGNDLYNVKKELSKIKYKVDSLLSSVEKIEIKQKRQAKKRKLTKMQVLKKKAVSGTTVYEEDEFYEVQKESIILHENNQDDDSGPETSQVKVIRQKWEEEMVTEKAIPLPQVEEKKERVKKQRARKTIQKRRIYAGAAEGSGSGSGDSGGRKDSN